MLPLVAERPIYATLLGFDLARLDDGRSSTLVIYETDKGNLEE